MLQKLGIVSKRLDTENQGHTLTMLTTVKEKKKSACEESWYTQNGIVKCGCPKRSLQARKKYVSSSTELTRGNFSEILVLGGNFCGKITVFSEPGNA